jgi:hypothetical protein
MILATALLIFAAQTPAQEPIPCDYIKQYVWDPKLSTMSACSGATA